MFKALVTIGLLLALGACRDDTAAPAWLADLQSRIAAEPVTNPPSRLLGFRYRGQPVVYRPGYCCDIQGVLYSETGAVLCHPDGGFSGRGDGRCPDFFAERTDCTVVWSDPRGKPAAGSGCPAPAPSTR